MDSRRPLADRENQIKSQSREGILFMIDTGASAQPPWTRTGYRDGSDRPARVRPPETVLAQEELAVERKKFKLSLRQNDRGRFVRVIEECGGVHNTVIIPVDGLAEFIGALQKLERACARPA